MLETIDWNQILYEADKIGFLLLALFALYLFVFSLFSLKVERSKYVQPDRQYRYAVFVLSRYPDPSVLETVHSFVVQDYPTELYDVFVVLNPTDEALVESIRATSAIPIVMERRELQKAAMVEKAMSDLGGRYDVAVLVSMNNQVEPDFLKEVNKAYYAGGMAIQAHKIPAMAKSNTSILNAVGEEINNAIFRRGHVNLGFSSSLIGSGMAFNFEWLRKNIGRVKGIGMTKQLESMLLRQGVFIEYLEHVHVRDSNIKKFDEFDRQRKEWYTAERRSLNQSLRHFPRALFTGNFDYCDKVFQWLMPSKYFLLLLTLVVAVALTIFNWTLAIKWLALLFILVFSVYIAIPGKMLSFRTLLALFALPLLAVSILKNSLRRSS